MRIGVVGAGIVGLAIARQLALSRPGAEVVVLEKEDRVAAHQTGHNSGVVHAGLYYEPGSLKAALCRRGAGMLRDYCADHGIAFREVGKLVVARGPGEMPRLRAIRERAEGNGVPDIALLDGAALREIEPWAEGFAAVHSPHTAVVDFVQIAEHFAVELIAAGGSVLFNSAVTQLRDDGNLVRLRAGDRTHDFDLVVVCAGLGGDGLAGSLNALGTVRIAPFRGEYYRLVGTVRDRVRGLIYPVPDPQYPFLGVHLTRGVDDDVLVGPNAVFALAYEGYRWRDVSVRQLREIIGWTGTRRLMRRHWRMGLRELMLSVSKRAFTEQARRYLPWLTTAHLERARSGVRAQAVDREGVLVDEFVIQTSGRVVLIRNAPSPAATSSLAIAEHVEAVIARG